MPNTIPLATATVTLAYDLDEKGTRSSSAVEYDPDQPFPPAVVLDALIRATEATLDSLRADHAAALAATAPPAKPARKAPAKRAPAKRATPAPRKATTRKATR